MQVKKNFLKLLLKALICLPRGVRTCGINIYISPLTEIRYPGRIFLAEGVVLERHARLCANLKDSKITIGDYTTISPYVLLRTNGGTIEIGKFSTVNDYTVIYGYGGVKIGDDVHIACHTTIVASSHDYGKLGTDKFSTELIGKGIVIEDSVWIGANVVIRDGITIGTHSVIGAGSVVTRDIPAYSLALGVPARVIKEIKQK